VSDSPPPIRWVFSLSGFASPRNSATEAYMGTKAVQQYGTQLRHNETADGSNQQVSIFIETYLKRMILLSKQMKVEDVYGYIALGLEGGRKEFTQKELSENLKGSLSTVHYALGPLERIGSISKKVRGFVVIDWKKFLVYWASVHKMRIDYSTYYPGSVEEIEGLMPPVLFTGYSGAKLYYRIEPADYGEVYVYGNGEVEKRFPQMVGIDNIYCLQTPFFLEGSGRTPLTTLYVDLWNIGKWYAKDYLKVVGGRLDELLE